MYALVTRPTAKAMAAAYETACRKIDNAFAEISEAKKLLKMAFVTPEQYVSSFIPYKFDMWSADDIKKEMKKACWYRILSLLELPAFMPTAKKRKLEKQIEEGDVPEPSEVTILSFCKNIYDNLEHLFDEMAEETCQWLQPGAWDEYKTNRASRFEISQKVIKDFVIDTSYGFVRLHGHGEENIQILDNVFHLLDGKGAAKAPNNAVTAIKQAIKEKKWECETQYFCFKWYKKGSLHIKFKRTDLLREFNKRVGRMKLGVKTEGGEL